MHYLRTLLYWKIILIGCTRKVYTKRSYNYFRGLYQTKRFTNKPIIYGYKLTFVVPTNFEWSFIMTHENHTAQFYWWVNTSALIRAVFVKLDLQCSIDKKYHFIIPSHFNFFVRLCECVLAIAVLKPDSTVFLW